MKRAGRVVLVVCLITATSRAENAPPPAPSAPATTAPATTPSTGTGADMNFDLFADQPKLSLADQAANARHAAEVERKSVLRRKLLTAHQVFGFATLGLLAVTVLLGTLDYVDKFGGGDYSKAYSSWHGGFAGATATTFAVSGTLALLAPNPYHKPVRFDTALVHKILMALATAGMVAQLVLGPISASREGHLDQKNFALAHLVIGYGTFVFMGTGTVAFLFK